VCGIQLVGLAIERVCINWLKNRYGCNHFKIAKFAELDIRKKAMKYRYPVMNPTYDARRYKQHYFLDDFDEIYNKIVNKTYAKYMEKKNAGELEETDVLANDPMAMRQTNKTKLARSQK
jgi:hypothetical protein